MTKLQELEKQVAEMQATIEIMKAEEAKPKKYILDYNQDNCFKLNYSTSKDIHGIDADLGLLRINAKVAEQSLARNMRANRLEALAEQLGGLVQFKPFAKQYGIGFDQSQWQYFGLEIFSPEVVYMTRKCAIEICSMLNRGEFKL